MFPAYVAPQAIPNPHTFRRLSKRINGFMAILRTPGYHAVYGLWLHGYIPNMPPVPDPTDLTVSKRAWEASVQAWRNELQRISRQHLSTP